jgi:hypothetical protein
MAAIAFVAPILPGKLEAWRRFNQETLGRWREAHDAANQRDGITRERAWLQQTPEGDMAIISLEVDDPERMFQSMATANSPYDTWFRQQVLEIHGLDLAAPSNEPLSVLEFDWRAS